MFTGVCLFTGGGACSRGSGPGGVPALGDPAPGGACSGGTCSRGVPARGWGVRSWGVPGGDPPTATAAGGKHPTGMHSCVIIILSL